MGKCSVERLGRKKVLDLEAVALPRVLTILDLTALGIGSTIGVGFYVLGGEVAQKNAGPAVTISFLIAAVASLFAGLCYAEFGGRVPRAGSAYIYTYVTIGEFIAFVIGWNLILEYVIGTASIAAGFSGYIDAFVGGVIAETMEEAMPMNISFLAPYPDLLAFALCIAISTVLAFGVKESSLMNNVVTIINLVVVTYVIIVAATLADVSNWSLSPTDINSTCPSNSTQDWGTGGFAPYGFQGIMAGAATCFYGFVGFDVIASTGEEAIRPERSLPISIGLSLTFIFIAYFSMSAVLTLAMPYCLLDASAPLIVLFQSVDMKTAEIIVSVGALFGFSASLFGAIFPMPRVIYAMASDGLLFRFLSKISRRFRSPIVATMVSGTFAAVMAMLFDLTVLIHMMSIGTLQAYTIVALCVMMLRYTIDPKSSELESLTSSGGDGHKGISGRQKKEQQKEDEWFSVASYWRQAFNRDKLTTPSRLSTAYVNIATLVFLIFCFTDTILLVVLASFIEEGDPASIASCAVIFAIGLLIVVTISVQPQSPPPPTFQVPFVPWLPALSCFFNLYLMCNLPANTWIKFVIWMIVGLAIYFFYGVWYDAPSRIVEEERLLGSGVGGPDKLDLEPKDCLEIPTIMVQPATPQTTMLMNEPPVFRRTSRDVVVSPLVTAELAEKKRRLEEQNQLEEGRDDGDKEGRNNSKSSSSSSDDDDSVNKIKSKEELVLRSAPPVNTTALGSSPDTGGADAASSGAGGAGAAAFATAGAAAAAAAGAAVFTAATSKRTSKDERAEKDALDSFDSALSSHLSPGASSPEADVTDENLHKELNDNTDIAAALAAGVIVPDVEEVSNPKIDSPDENSGDKKEKFPDLTLHIPPPIKSTDTANGSHPDTLNSSQSAPEMAGSVSPAPSDDGNNKAPVGKHFSLDDIDAVDGGSGGGSSDGGDRKTSGDFGSVSSSVPVSPVLPRRTRRPSPQNPNKPLKRMSSFEVIPPSSPDSPMAKRVNAFVVIPVAEPPIDDDGQDDDALFELNRKLNNVQSDKTSKPDANLLNVEDDESKDRANSFEALIHSTDGDWINKLPDPIITADTREFKNNLEDQTHDLQTIRERGESKLLPDEIDSGSLPLLANATNPPNSEDSVPSPSIDKNTHVKDKDNIIDKEDTTASVSSSSSNSRDDNSPPNPDLGAFGSSKILQEKTDDNVSGSDNTDSPLGEGAAKKPSVKDLQAKLLKQEDKSDDMEMNEASKLNDPSSMRSSTSISALRNKFQ